MRTKKLLLPLLLILPVFLQAQPAPDTTFRIYLLMGQSNMAGRGSITEEYKNQQHPHVWMLDKTASWVPARHPLHFDKPKVVGVGPGLAFGIKMAEAHPGSRIGLVPCAVGGTAIERWEPGAYDSATKTHPYDDALVRIRTAMKSGVICGVIWHQGESNSGAPEGYTDKLETLIRRVREEVKNPRLPFVAGELGTYRPVYLKMNPVIGQLPSRVPFTAVATSEGLVHKGDTTHFDSPSATLLGERYAVKMLELEATAKGPGRKQEGSPLSVRQVHMHTKHP